MRETTFHQGSSVSKLTLKRRVERLYYTEAYAYSCTRKVATVLLDAMLLDLSHLGHNGLVHNAREDSWQLN